MEEAAAMALVKIAGWMMKCCGPDKPSGAKAVLPITPLDSETREAMTLVLRRPLPSLA